MWPRNAFTDRLDFKWPILQAPMGWLSTPALAAAVSNAGGLGGLGMWGFSAEDAERRIAGFRQLSGESQRKLSALARAQDWPRDQRADAGLFADALRRERPGSGARANGRRK